MYELIKAGERSYYINCPVKIGIYLQSEKDVYLIDSGNDKEAARKVKKTLEEKCFNLKGILNTHSHGDHIGGNQYLQNQYNCSIFADKKEIGFIENPITEPAFLYGGYPFNNLRHKLLMAKPSKVKSFDDLDFPRDIKIIDLKGHSFGMSGFLLPDKTFFIGDSVSSKETIKKYKITYLYDVEQFLASLDILKEIKAEKYIPSHAAVTEDIVSLVEINKKAVYETLEFTENLCKEGVSFETILKKVFDEFDLNMTCEQNVLLGSTLRSYLSYLIDNKRVFADFKDNILYYKKI